MTELSVGLLGAGHIAAAHLAAWRRAHGCRAAGVYDLDRAQAEARARRFRLPRVFADAGELIAACDVVDVCTPPHTHAELIRRAAEAGRHVLVEKPVVTRAAEWRALQPLIERSAGELAVVHNLKFARSVETAMRWLAAGRIGTLLRLEREFLTDPASDRMLGGRHWSHALPGGRWFETLPHELYLVHALAGPLDVTSVVARRVRAEHGGAPAGEVLVALAGADVVATLHYSSACRLNRRRLTLVGTDGAIEVDLLSDSARLIRRRDRRWKRALGAGLLDGLGALASALPDRLGWAAERLRGDSPHRRLIAAFAAHLHGRGPSPSPLDEIAYVVENAEAIGLAIDAQVAAAAGPGG